MTWKWIKDLLRAFPDPAGIIPTGNSRLLLQSDLKIKYRVAQHIDKGIKSKYLLKNLVFSKKCVNTKIGRNNNCLVMEILHYPQAIFCIRKPLVKNIYNLFKVVVQNFIGFWDENARFFLTQKLHRADGYFTKLSQGTFSNLNSLEDWLVGNAGQNAIKSRKNFRNSKV